jgi:hypothetical protein
MSAAEMIEQGELARFVRRLEEEGVEAERLNEALGAEGSKLPDE